MRVRLGDWEWEGDGEGLGFVLLIGIALIGMFTVMILAACGVASVHGGG